MSAMIDNMVSEALARHTKFVNRSCCQRKRQVKASFAEIMPTRDDLSQVAREAGNIQFADVEPPEPITFAQWTVVVGLSGLTFGIFYGAARWVYQSFFN
jgi:hypothetical protein